jgi:purine-cytosine permease-like protein
MRWYTHTVIRCSSFIAITVRKKSLNSSMKFLMLTSLCCGIISSLGVIKAAFGLHMQHGSSRMTAQWCP